MLPIIRQRLRLPVKRSLEWLNLIYLLYSLLLGAGMLLSAPYWAFQMLRHGKYRKGLSERFGHVPSRLGAGGSAAQAQPVIWVHAVSVGEVLAICGLVEELRRRFPEHRIVLSTTTDSGQALARKRFGEKNVFYFPMDFAFAILPYLRALRPQLVVIAETEFWPNFLHLAEASGASIAIVNARISDRSWPNYQRFRWALRKVLANVDLFLDRKSTRLNSSHANISYAVFCLKKKKTTTGLSTIAQVEPTTSYSRT